MEAYKLLHMISEGPLGPTLLVEDKASGEKLVVKQVECRDYTQALQAYHQAVELERVVRHSAICSYRQFFVHWEREAHAVYLCSVTPYQELGSLTAFIEKQRAENENIDEELLRSWVLQLVGGVGHTHNQGLLHRNLKPSNILLSSPTSLLLVDFAVPVVLENMMEVIRKRGGSLLWLAPEEMNKKTGEEGGSEKADVWSLGCVLLQLTTCSFMDASDCCVLLQRLHRDPSVLQEALEAIKELYSVEVCQLVESCLRRSVEQRPSISELMNSPLLHQMLADSSDEAGSDEDNRDDVLSECGLSTDGEKNNGPSE